MLFVEIAKIRLTQKFTSQLIAMKNNTNEIYFSQTWFFKEKKQNISTVFFLGISYVKLVFYPSILEFS